MCSICLQEFENPSDIVQLPCDHNFHGACIASWLWRTPSCPNCRRGHADDDHEEEEEERYNDGVIARRTLQEFLDDIRRQREESRKTISANIRRSKRSDAPKALVKNVRRMREWRQNSQETRRCLKSTVAQLKSRYRAHSLEVRDLRQQQQTEMAHLLQRQKEDTRTMRAECSAVRRKLSRETGYFLKYRQNLERELFV